LLLLVIAGGPALAQTDARLESAASPREETSAPSLSKTKPKSAEADSQAEIKAIRDQGAKYLEECLNDWAADSHMTKQEWTSACRRVVEERVKFLLDNAKKR